jgi:hypothetical protein
LLSKKQSRALDFVSRTTAEFGGMSALDRQTLIDKALRSSTVKFSKQERRNILAIAALTPAEFETVDPTFLGSHP